MSGNRHKKSKAYENFGLYWVNYAAIIGTRQRNLNRSKFLNP